MRSLHKSWKKRVRLGMSLLLVFVLMANSIYGIGDINFSVTRTTTPEDGKIFAGETLNIDYTIQPNDVEAGLAGKSEIALVIDTSGSMTDKDDGKTSRIDAAKAAAKAFVDNFAGMDNVRISIIDYDYYAVERTALLQPDSSALVYAINELKAGGYTNIGDGIRVGFHQLLEGDDDASKFMIFMTDGYANRSTRKSSWFSSSEYYGSGIVNQSKSLSYYRYNGISYAQNMTGKLEVGSSINPDMYVKPYFIAFSNNASTLRSIAYYHGNTSKPRVTGLEYNDIGTADALVDYYDDIAKEIIDEIAVELNFKESFVGTVDIEEILISDIQGFDLDQVQVTDADGTQIVESIGDGWQVEYVYNEAEGVYKADPIKLSLRITATKAGYYKYGGGGSSYVSYVDADGEEQFIDFPESAFEAFEINAPVINMSQEEDSQVRTFNLSYTGTANMHFGGNDTGDYVEMDMDFSDDFFSPSQHYWTMKAVIEPDELTGDVTNHEVSNVFFSKASDAENDNVEIGIDTSGNLLLYLDTADSDQDAIPIGNGELTVGKQHDVIITYDYGVVTVSLDGHEYVATQFTSTNNPLDGADGSDFTLGGSLHSDIFYDGSINEVTLYKATYSAEEIYEGNVDATDIEASWKAYDTTSSQLVDSSGNGYHSTSVNGPYLQEDLDPDKVTLQYKIGDDVSAVWVDYTEGDEIVALSDIGSVTVYARATYDPDGEGEDIPYYSHVVDKVASLANNKYVDQVIMSLGVGDSDISADDDFTVTYTLRGDELVISDALIDKFELDSTDTDKTYLSLNSIYVEIAYPSTVTVKSSGDLTDHPGSNYLSGIVTDAVLKKNADNLYELVDYVLDVEYEPVDWTDVAFADDTVSISYEDYFEHNVAFTSGNSLDVNVRPIAPTIDDVTGDNIVYTTDTISGVTFTGDTYSDIAVDVYVIGTDLESDLVKLRDGTEYSISSGGDGSFESSGIDLSLLMVLQPTTVYAVVQDAEGDTATGSKDFDIMIPPLDFNIK